MEKIEDENEIEKNKNYKMTIYDDERLMIKLHDMNPFKNRTAWNGRHSTRDYKDKYLSIKDYMRSLRSWTKRLYSLDIKNECCRFITLTLEQKMDWNELILKFKIFLNTVRRNFGKFEYIRAIEIQENSRYFHIHAILVFEDNQPNITNEWLKKHWKYGYSYIDEKLKVYDVYGLLQYLTLNKNGYRLPNSCFYTCYPKGAKIIVSTVNRHSKKREIEINQDELDWIYRYAQKEYYSNDGKHIREDGHYYYDGQNTKFCLDALYIRTSKDFVYNNFGTEEDQKILEENSKIEKEN